MEAWWSWAVLGYTPRVHGVVMALRAVTGQVPWKADPEVGWECFRNLSACAGE